LREKIVDLLSHHDVIAVIGAPAFTYHVEGMGPHIPAGARLYQLTDDPDTAAWTPIGLSVVGSIKLGLLDLLSRPSVKVRERPVPRSLPERAAFTQHLSAAYVFQTICEVRSGDEIIVEEAPSSRSAMQQYLPITRSEGYFTMDSGGLGFGMPAAIGIALGRPGARVICIVGDGSSMYSIQALWSASQWKLPITFVIINNRRYAALQNFASQFGFAADETVQGTTLAGIDFVALAKGMGCQGQRVSDSNRLATVLAEALNRPGPTLIEVEVQ
jgi:benzoylformate decarboxylase